MSDDLENVMEEVSESKIPALLYEMMRSFTVLASTRQTVRRHIAQLEELMGVTLFAVDDRRYHLTARGEEALPEALEIMARGKTWALGDLRSVGGLMRLSHEQPNGWTFYQQQQSLTQIWGEDRPFYVKCSTLGFPATENSSTQSFKHCGHTFWFIAILRMGGYAQSWGKSRSIPSGGGGRSRAVVLDAHWDSSREALNLRQC